MYQYIRTNFEAKILYQSISPPPQKSLNLLTDLLIFKKKITFDQGIQI